MWIFGYGSLMWDGWEVERGCLRRLTADLRGYARAFNKRSVRNWGTRENPGLTLNLIAADSVCRGAAFEFPDDACDDVRAYLAEREGKDFNFRELPIVLDGDVIVMALVPLYQGQNVIKQCDVSEIAAMALCARGSSGSCTDYIKCVATQLQQIGITDPFVIDLCSALDDAAPNWRTIGIGLDPGP